MGKSALWKKPVVFALLALGVGSYLNRSVPHEQRIRFVLGSRATELTDLAVEYIPVPADDLADAQRAVTFHYAHGAAPPVVLHEPKLKNGPYQIHCEVTAGERHATISRRIEVDEHSVSVDLSDAISAEATR